MSYSRAKEARVVGKQPCSVLQETAIEKEPPSSGGTGSKHWADISVSATLLQKEPSLCRLHAEEKK